MEIIKTTDYFNKTIDELSELRNDNTWTREECLICDDGLKVCFYSTLENLESNYEETTNYYKSIRLELKAVLEMQVPNTNGNKYAMVFD